jgi:hypothetical protein
MTDAYHLTEITVFTKEGGPLTKRIRLAEDGSVVSDASCCTMVRGRAKRQKIINVEQLSAIIEHLTSDQAIALGALRFSPSNSLGMRGEPPSVLSKPRIAVFGGSTVEDWVLPDKSPLKALADKHGVPIVFVTQPHVWSDNMSAATRQQIYVGFIGQDTARWPLRDAACKVQGLPRKLRWVCQDRMTVNHGFRLIGHADRAKPLRDYFWV